MICHDTSSRWRAPISVLSDRSGPSKLVNSIGAASDLIYQTERPGGLMWVIRMPLKNNDKTIPADLRILPNF